MMGRQDVMQNPKLTPHQIKGALRRRKIASSYNVNPNTISRLRP